MRRRLLGRVEQLQIDPARPQVGVLDAETGQLVRHALIGHKHPLRRAVKPLQPAPEPACGNARALVDVLGELGVEGGGKGDLVALTKGARGHAQRAFGGHVDGVDRALFPDNRLDPAADSTRPEQRQPDFLVHRHGHIDPELVRGDAAEGVALVLDDGSGGVERPNHAVDLRMPGITHQKNVHQPTRSFCSSRPSSDQYSRLSCPSASSTSAVQDSTQSPQLA